MSQKAVRRTVRALSVREKLDAIDRVHDGESKAAVARDIGVPESTLRGWCKGEEKLRGSVALQDNGSLNDAPLDFSRSSPTLMDYSRNSPLLNTPLDFSSERSSPSPIVAAPLSLTPKSDPAPYPPTEEIKQDSLLYWMQQGQANLPISPLEARTADSASWFWKWYKNYGVLPPNDSGTKLSRNEDEPPATASDALYHGEKFLQWLDGCSDPSVTALQILQFKSLLNRVKDCAERRRNGKTPKIRRRK